MRITSRLLSLRFTPRYLAVLAGCLLLSACAGGAAIRSEQALQWPPLPRPATIKWVKEIGSYRDAGIRKGIWARMADAVIGADEARIARPYGIFVDEKERLYIVDVDLGIVHVMDRKENSYREIGGGERKVFVTPIGITGDNAGRIFITDSEAGVVYRYNTHDKTLVPFVTSLRRPTGIAYNRFNGLLYVSETVEHRISVFDEKGALRYSFGGRGEAPGKFNLQTDLFIDSGGKLYVTDPLNARVQIFSADGKLLQAFGEASDTPGDFMKPKGVAVDSGGNIYVCDSLRDAVQVYTADRGYFLTFGLRGQSAGEFWMPSGLYIDRNDMIYVADTYNSRIQVFQYSRPAAEPGESGQPRGLVPNPLNLPLPGGKALKPSPTLSR